MKQTKPAACFGQSVYWAFLAATLFALLPAALLPAAAKDEEKPHWFGTAYDDQTILAHGIPDSEDFLFDPSGTRLFYNGEDGLVVTDPDSGVTRRLQGTAGTPSEVRPISRSADGEILVYSSNGSCTRDGGEDDDRDKGGDDSAKRICLAYLPPVGARATKTGASTVSTRPNVAPADDPWVGRWEGSGEGNLSATIRRGTAKPDYLVIDLVTGVPGCSGAVTLYGKPKRATVLGESYEPNEPGIPVCRVELSLDKKGMLTVGEVGACTYYHGASCGFEGTMTRSK